MKKVTDAYRLGGMTLHSEIPLPELPLAQPLSFESHPVEIRLEHALETPPGAVELDPDCFATARRYFLRVPGIASYQVNNGEEILVCPEPGALPLDVRAYLLGTLFVVLCQQRGLLPLHASAVITGEGVVAFVARSGQGKSSLAAHLAQRGFPVVGDDICLIDSSGERAMVVPAAPWLKLWRNSLEMLGRRTDGLERVFSEDDKYRLPLETPLLHEPIHRIVFLESSERSAPELEEVTAIEAIPLLMNLTHQAYVLEGTGQRQESFLRCSRVSSQARSYRLLRSWGLVHLEPTVDMLEKFLRRQ
ncbi:MAG: hypothetical protein WA510_23340 [Acidobacteriaceae bacterium]